MGLVAKPVLFWLDQLVASREVEVPDTLLDKFNVRHVSGVPLLERLLLESPPDCLFFDFDYPDRQRLSEFARIKGRFPSLPCIIMTLQHSESLAIWAFRHGALDYLIKPLQPEELVSCIDRIIKITEAKKIGQRRICQYRKPAIPFAVPNTPRKKKDRLSPAVFYIQQHYSERIYSDAMARICGMSPSQFSRAFKQEYGLTFQDFLLRYRVQQACKFLAAPVANIADVAYNVGFSDPSYFTRIFKRFVGVAPSEYAAANDDSLVTPEEVGLQADDMSSSSQIVRSLSAAFVS